MHSRWPLRVTRVDIGMSALTSAFPSNGHSQRSGKQRLQRRAAMIRRHEAAGALELLARCTDGCSEAVLLAHGFRPKLIPELVRTGLATTQTEHVHGGGRVI